MGSTDYFELITGPELDDYEPIQLKGTFKTQIIPEL